MAEVALMMALLALGTPQVYGGQLYEGLDPMGMSLIEFPGFQSGLGMKGFPRWESHIQSSVSAAMDNAGWAL